MKQVDLSIERLLELRDNPRFGSLKPGETVQLFLERWCQETFGERPLVTMIQRVTRIEDQYPYDHKSPGGLAFEFKEPKNAIMFKLSWL